ncbi:Cytochrome P450 2J5 [Araneus ventricosus]|uniref:Cytochrome P450 2J5 n=1 Tax=Araneus ventricosus TaxID=182803 RepID=A0A4Y2BV38_ARAVE|nr:Cytochrome P450 2J5 [Araneus ventricosus]
MASEVVYNYYNFKNFSPAIGSLLLVIGSFAFWKLLPRVLQWYDSRRKRVPGPTGLPLVGYLPFLGNEPHKKFWEMREKYGDVIGIDVGRKFLVVLNEYKVMKEVLCHPAALNRAPDLFRHLGHSGFVSENGERWIEQRRYSMTVARDLGLGRGQWQNLVKEETVNFLLKLRQLKGKPTDISHELAISLASNIISLLIGRRLSEDEAEKLQLSVNYSDVALIYMGPSNPTTIVPALRKVCEVFKIAGYDKAMKIIQSFSSFIKEEINRHKISRSFQDVPDFINSYLVKISEMSSSNDMNHGFSETTLEGTLNLLFLASSDTIFSSLGWLFRLMCEHKDIQDKVYAELTDVLGKDGEARYEGREKIPYTFAVIMEAQRYGSIVPLSGSRIAFDDIPVNGYIIPKGSEITANLWALHHDPSYWDEPGEFRPERFLTDDGTKLIRHLSSYAPFSVGRRNCPGETIAWMEILSYFSEVIRNFEISTPLGLKPEFKIVNGLVSRLAPQALCFKERNA